MKTKLENPIFFFSKAIEELTENKAAIAAAPDFNTAKSIAAASLGFTDCLVVLGNSCDSSFPDDYMDVVDGWCHKIYQALVNKAIETHQPDDVQLQLMQKRDEYPIF